jgi:hypothetical protein
LFLIGVSFLANNINDRIADHVTYVDAQDDVLVAKMGDLDLD